MKIEADERLNVLGLYCPMPIVRAAQKMKELRAGQVLEVLATDEGIMEDIPAWCKSAGNEFLGIERVGRIYRAYIRKGDVRRETEYR